MNLEMARPGLLAQNWIERDKLVISSSYPREYPLVIDRGRGSEVWDVDGNRYVDFMAGIGVLSTGHCHPQIVQAIRQQSEEFLHVCGSDFYYAQQIALAEKLVSIAPMEGELNVCFSNSGTEAVEAALKLARWSTRKQGFIGFVGAFHGRTMGSLAFTSSKNVQRHRFGPFMPGVYHANYSYPYRCPNGRSESTCRNKCICASLVEGSILDRLAGSDDIAAVLVEPIQGEGGFVFPADDFLPELRDLCTRKGILMIVDEIQSGMGRTGKWWAVQHWNVEPDILCVSKGIASGMPLGVVVARKEIMNWPAGAHGSTFAGNPVSCRAALATIDLLENGDEVTGPFIRNAATIGEYMLKRLTEMQGRHASMGRVQGKGLMIGVELVVSRNALDCRPPEPALALRNNVVATAFRMGLLLLECGKSDIRLTPALNINREFVDEGLDIFERALSTAEEAVETESMYQ